MIVGGDFNVDFERDKLHTRILNDFCAKCNMSPVCRHTNYCIDYTFNNNIKHFPTIDHFLLSEQLYQTSVNKAYVSHDSENFSDHDPVHVLFNLSVARVNIEKRVYKPHSAWHKANNTQIYAYRSLLQAELRNIVVPYEVLLCNDVMCHSALHTTMLSHYADQITQACLTSAKATVPVTKPCGESGRIPDWCEFVAPLKNQSLFWHNIWIDCGKPHSGVVADIMHKTRSRCHAAVRQARRNQNDIVNNRIALALAENNNRQFWSEIKRIRQTKCTVGGVIDGRCSSSDIADLFAEKYHDLYTSVPFDEADMQLQCIRNELTASLTNSDIVSSFVSVPDVLRACGSLKAGKNDADIGLSTDHFINAGGELATHVSLLFSGMLIHGFAPSDMSVSTITPIPKGRNANIADSTNYRGISLCSIFVKLFDLIFLDKFSSALTTSELQFGFKANHSTTMCSMVLKETLAYYSVDGGTAFCTFLDATKAFDRVDYCKIFRELLKRDIPSVYVRLLLNMYTNSVAKVRWNGAYVARLLMSLMVSSRKVL